MNRGKIQQFLTNREIRVENRAERGKGKRKKDGVGEQKVGIEEGRNRERERGRTRARGEVGERKESKRGCWLRVDKPRETRAPLRTASTWRSVSPIPLFLRSVSQPQSGETGVVARFDRAFSPFSWLGAFGRRDQARGKNDPAGSTSVVIRGHAARRTCVSGRARALARSRVRVRVHYVCFIMQRQRENPFNQPG